MPEWRHPDIGPITLMPIPFQHKNTWKHFYNLDEQWDQLCEGDPQSAAEAATRITGHNPQRVREFRTLDDAAQHRVRPVLERDHDASYGPAYLSEMKANQTIWADAPVA